MTTEEKQDIPSNPQLPDLPGLSPELGAIVKTVLQVEEMRADTINRQTEASRKSIEMHDRANQRKADLDRLRLDYAKETADKRIKTGARIAYAAMVLFAIPLLFVLAMLFFGDEFQRKAAQNILVYSGVGIAGFGLISTLRLIVRKILRQPPE